MSTLVIQRANETTNCFRNIRIFIDNKEVSKIANGEIKRFDIKGGLHTVEARIDWCSSNRFHLSINENEVYSLSLESYARKSSIGILSMFYYMLFRTDRYLHLT